jgi:hypothetical protein
MFRPVSHSGLKSNHELSYSDVLPTLWKKGGPTTNEGALTHRTCSLTEDCVEVLVAAMRGAGNTGKTAAIREGDFRDWSWCIAGLIVYCHFLDGQKMPRGEMTTAECCTRRDMFGEIQASCLAPAGGRGKRQTTHAGTGVVQSLQCSSRELPSRPDPEVLTDREHARELADVTDPTQASYLQAIGGTALASTCHQGGKRHHVKKNSREFANASSGIFQADAIPNFTLGPAST